MTVRRRSDDSLSVPQLVVFGLIILGFGALGLLLNYALIKWVVAN